MSNVEKFYNNLLEVSGYFPTFLWILPLSVAITKWKKLNKNSKALFFFGLWMFLLNICVQAFLWSATKHYVFWKPYLDNWHIDNSLFTRILFHFNAFIYLGYGYFSLISIDFLNKICTNLINTKAIF